MPSVVGRARDNAKVYDVDAVGKPLTPVMAQAIRDGKRTPHLVARGLAQNPAPFVPPRASDDPYPLTTEGARVRKLLGTIPTEHVRLITFNGRVVDRKYDTAYCRGCHAFHDARLIAWADPEQRCINCAKEGT